MLGKRIDHLPLTAWIALWLMFLAPAMCQRHGLLYFHAVALESSPAWADDFMCGSSAAPSEQRADAQHHTTRVLQSSLSIVFLMPEPMLAIETAQFALTVALEDERVISFASEPPLPPPRYLSVA